MFNVYEINIEIFELQNRMASNIYVVQITA
jgi:hypothetical protein